jgi:hypothetical protein
MITPDEYPAYNHRERPGIGRDHLGNTFYNCFSVKLEKDKYNRYRPFLFSDFINQYDRYAKYSGTCSSCISSHAIITFRADDKNVDRSAVHRKFANGEIESADYYYCPLTHQVLSALQLSIAPSSQEKLPAEPIQAILSDNWDDSYLFEFLRIVPPQQMGTCPILKEVLSSKLISTVAERSFFVLWFLTMFYQMDTIRQSGQRIYLEECDFDTLENKLYKFLFPVPQVWLYIIPKPPPGVDWQEWERQYQKESLAQRVDFLFTYDGKRHVVEIDDVSHYAVQSRETWIASEPQYRKTLSDTRWLKICGFEVHRFTNDELLELYNPNSSNTPDINGFGRLLRTEGLEPRKMVFLDDEHV